MVLFVDFIRNDMKDASIMLHFKITALAKTQHLKVN